jgi:secondary thiamine-phosphate synthase enzyme
MKVVTRRLTYQTRGDNDITDITPDVAREVAASGVGAGTVTVFVTGSTAGIAVIEREAGLLSDFQGTWERLVPRGHPYRHNVADDNAHSHLRASLLGPSLVIPLVAGRLTLGTWQQVVLVDFDTRPRRREVVVQIVGE